jgi:ribosome-binding protein aMBF1 (putative translation factor)
MKPSVKPARSAEQRAEEAAIRQQHAATPARRPAADSVSQQSFLAILGLMARFKSARESQGLSVAEIAERMGIDAAELSGMETGKILNPNIAMLHKWAEALGHKLDIELSAA